MKLAVTLRDYRDRPLELDEAGQRRLMNALVEIIMVDEDLRKITGTRMNATIEWRPDLRPEDILARR